MILFAAAVFMTACNGGGSKLPDLRERYGYQDTRPFGAYTAFRMLNNIYPGKFINLSGKRFSTLYNSTYFDSSSFYMNISSNYLVDDDDAEALLNFVYEGHTAFIAASTFDTSLLQRIYTQKADPRLWMMFATEKYANTSVSLPQMAGRQADTFSYFYQPLINHFTGIDAASTRILGYSAEGKPNFFVYFRGNGRLFLHAEPRTFSNYFLLTGQNHLYFKEIMQMMNSKPGNVFWDNYYHNIEYRSGKSPSAFSAILRHPALAMAFWIILGALLLYVLMGAKRRLRSMPVIAPVQNTSIAFTEAVAGLYLTEKDNRNIAEKMTGYFNEFIRTHYFLTGHAGNAEFIAQLSKKSGVEHSRVQAMYYAMQQASDSAVVSDDELLALNNHIQHFYKNRN